VCVLLYICIDIFFVLFLFGWKEISGLRQVTCVLCVQICLLTLTKQWWWYALWYEQIVSCLFLLQLGGQRGDLRRPVVDLDGTELPVFYRSLRGRAAPDILLIHCGGNDLGVVSSVQLVNTMKEDLLQHKLRHPGMKIMFSAVTQRCRWKAGANPVKIDKARKFVNSVMATFVRSLNSAMIEHPCIRHDSPGLFLKDGVHFTPRGNDMFLSTLANCLKGHIQMQ